MRRLPRILLVAGVLLLNIALGVLIGALVFGHNPASLLRLGNREETSGGKPVSMTGLSLQEAYNRIAEKNVPAVVSLEVTTMSMERSPLGDLFGDDEFMKRFFGLPPERFSRRKGQSFGSGFVISEDGYLVSNYHVVKNAVKILVRFKGRDREVEAVVIGVDAESDIALLKLKGKGPWPVTYLGDSDEVKIGDIAVAIGNPFGLSSTFTTGVISAVGRRGIGNQAQPFLQTSAPINPGNSGGPLLNLRGEVVGVNTMIYSQSGGSIGIGFAIPANHVRKVVDELRKSGKVTRPYLGVILKDLDRQLAAELGAPEGSVYVPEVAKGSPAEKAGLLPGDIILSFEGKRLSGSADLHSRIGELAPGKQVSLEVLRLKGKLTLVATLESLGDQAAVDGEDAGVYLDMKVGPMTPELMAQYRVREPIGVVVESLEESSPLAEKGAQPGDLVIMVNYKETRTIGEYNKAMQAGMKNKKMVLHLRRGSAVYPVGVTIK